jgi:predicted lipid-binding transport protein (Tim44 family)
LGVRLAAVLLRCNGDGRYGAHFESGRYRHYVGSNFQRVETEKSLTAIIILALVALFIGLRLYSVLGERTGHEQPILKPADPEADARIAPRAQASNPASVAVVEPDELAYLPTAGPGVRALLAADPSFDVGRFLEGSKAAYRLILEAFWKGDVEAMRPYVDAHVLETFAGAVEQRTKDGLVLDNRLVAIDQALIAGAEIDRSVALVTVRFEADIAAITKNSAGEVVAGSLSDAVQTRDRWTFRRDISSRDPNWILVETDEEE